MTSTTTGPITKMRATVADPLDYALPVGTELVPMNAYLGNTLRLTYAGEIRCMHCGRATKKSFQQGYCYPCFKKLAQCDFCILKPELCHYHLGTCREPSWGREHCLISHTIYLSNASGLKVGITRSHQVMTRWIDQGAAQALPIRTVATRLESGKVEVAYKQLVADTTNWRKLLSGEATPLDLAAERDRLKEALPEEQWSALPGTPVEDGQVTIIRYPVLAYPAKINSHNLEKVPLLEGTLLGIKGQYLMFDGGVINMRKYGGYCLTVG